MGTGLTLTRRFTKDLKPGMNVLEMIPWKKIDVDIKNEKGKVIFTQKDLEVPEWFDDQDAAVCANKYLAGKVGTPERETSFKQVYTRVVTTVTRWGILGGYFNGKQNVDIFFDEFMFILMTGKAAPNSPVWFNLGNPYSRPQASACFTNSVEDTMESILDLGVREGMQFKYGSGSGVNVSPIRSKREDMSGGGHPSGPVAYMRGWDKMAGAIESGGKTRRAAKMVIIDVDHPDTTDFINHKYLEEIKAQVLISAGYDSRLDGEAYKTVDGQNANNSLRVPDDFMHAVLGDGQWCVPDGVEGVAPYDHIPLFHRWSLIARTTGRIIEVVDARDIWNLLCERAHQTGCPGIQFDTTINRFNKVPSMGRKCTTNPCSEFDNVNDTACNLLSQNLRRFQNEDGSFKTADFVHSVEICTIAQEIIVGDSTGELFVQCSCGNDPHEETCDLVNTKPWGAVYPTATITERTQACRPIGAGYTNAGSFLMCYGAPYDSDLARSMQAGITALLSGTAWATSARIARDCGGAYPAFAANRQAHMDCIDIYADRARALCNVRAHEPMLWVEQHAYPLQEDLSLAILTQFEEARGLGLEYGFRNNEVTCIAPTGTISYLMGARCMSGEPAMALISYKQLVGGGTLKLVIEDVRQALVNLEYTPKQIDLIFEYLLKNDTIEGSILKEEDLPIFDCAMKPANGKRTIGPMGHVRMLAAMQTFVSMSVSKTVNLPNEATVKDFHDTYLAAWNMGCKCVAAYRDGSKKAQPVSANKNNLKTLDVLARGTRIKLPPTRVSITHGFSIGGAEGYFQLGVYPETGEIGEIFISSSNEAATLNGMLAAFSISTSYGLQYGVPMEVFIEKFKTVSFPPSGFTGNEDIPRAGSIISFIFRWIGKCYQKEASGVLRTTALAMNPGMIAGTVIHPVHGEVDAVVYDVRNCQECGLPMQRTTGQHCYTCPNCGTTEGFCGAG